MSQFKFNKPIEHIAKPKEFPLSSAALYLKLEPLKLRNIYLWDSYFWAITLEDWNKVLRDVCLGMPKYSTSKFDCENFAMLTAARVSERYQINTCGVAVGASPFGEHGYNLLVCPDTLIYFEPQTGEFVPVEYGSYKAHFVLFGG
ncbi:MAG: hypothetical protein KKB38_20060 [Gammaproteobacteria bacterium]|nr:hypothetical protein [Gammaproteobacteria bacterium]